MSIFKIEKTKDNSISYDDIENIELKYDNQPIVWYNGYKSDLLSEDIDSNEIFSGKKVRNIKKWYYEIIYILNDKNQIESIKIS